MTHMACSKSAGKAGPQLLVSTSFDLAGAEETKTPAFRSSVGKAERQSNEVRKIQNQTLCGSTSFSQWGNWCLERIHLRKVSQWVRDCAGARNQMSWLLPTREWNGTGRPGKKWGSQHDSESYGFLRWLLPWHFPCAGRGIILLLKSPAQEFLPSLPFLFSSFIAYDRQSKLGSQLATASFSCSVGRVN